MFLFLPRTSVSGGNRHCLRCGVKLALLPTAGSKHIRPIIITVGRVTENRGNQHLDV